ncbi:glycoside hydrolase family 13 protein [Cylindrobasidium torrendii FP15055 ss-10]|uniref:Glycoside hydrolase family 13 protein n=1 Tax=Cylindrobasidium torrendii FP15055 ss-10 TaxID=1314674 RepID=A0A0D7B0V3_9AGAR|nr:glycoside hydrolase family 13 protein [Cylindrobasidium torrendii FP15055 ss-10]
MSKDANAEYAGKEQNYTMMQAYEWYSEGGGKHWNLLNSKLDEFADMGITAMWLPPPTKASGKDSVGYDIYDLYDLGEFDQKGSVRTKYGTKEELLALTKAAREKGIVSYIDAVLNHRFGADKTERFSVVEVDANDRTKEVSGPKDIKGWTRFDFPGRKDKYSSFKYRFHHFSGVDYDAETGNSAIYRIRGDFKEWANDVDEENGNYDFLMGADIDYSHPEAKEDTLNWGAWVIKETDAAGFRFDAVKHIEAGFIADFVKHTRKESGKPKMFAVGEFWKDSLEDLESYLGSLETQFSVFDAPLHYNFKEAGEAKENFDMRAIWDGTVVQKRPIDAVTLVDNHDTQVGQALESWVSSGFKPLAYSLILLRPDGYPCVFYGDLYGTLGENPQQPVSQLADIIRARKLYAYGELRDYSDHMNCLGWVRMGDERRSGCAVVLCNGSGDGEKRMEVGKERAGQKWTDVLGWYQGEIEIEEDGWATFKCHSESVSIWVNADAEGRDEFEKK